MVLRWILLGIGIVAIGTMAWLLWKPVPESAPVASIEPVSSVSSQLTTSPKPQPLPTHIEPVANFAERVTKKPFGIHVTPQDSPVQPEHFTGYHTGADSEYGDVDSDVPVHAVADGEVVLSRLAQGYGGVMVIRHTKNDKTFLALYGHLKPSSILKTGTKVSAGEQIAILGKGFSAETDGERKHLHFAIIKGDTVTIKGYVQTKAELDGWEDPVTFLKSL